MLGVKEEIKSIIVKSGFTMSKVIEMLNEKHERKDSVANLSNKLTRGTLKYREAKEIADVMGYEIVWVEKK